uniref:Wu:fj64h06 n=1 Tax=Sparus aurata TaxID=8175 RepID=A0A671UXC1_SPAAU
MLYLLSRCQQTYTCKSLNAYSTLMSDVVHGIPPELLGALLHEELTEQRDRQLLCEGATGGSLAFIPFSQSDSRSQNGCLLYAGSQGLDKLNFHMVELQHHRGGSSCVDTGDSDPFCFQLKGPIRQINCVGVRSPHLCGVWRFSERNEPHLLQVVNTKEVATCISISPHVLGEVLVVSESGVAKLWTVGRGMQTVREEDHNLYFNAKSSWRWCEFSAHPRVMLYADRTGVELTDIRVNPALCHTLFRISNTSGCRSGERLLLSRYLGNVHSFHHLISTQYSAYIMDERFPSVPMLKCDHMMQSPPIFCDVIPGSVFSGSAEDGAKTTKVLLGSHSSQEITMLQYSGLTSIQKKGGREAGADECICILQLTEAGDIFYQILEPEQRDASRPSTVEDEPLPQQGTKKQSRTTAEQLHSGSQLFASDTSSDEDVIGPTQGPTVQRLVPETQVKERELNVLSDASSEDSESARKGPKLRRMSLQVVVNDPELDPVSGLDADKKDENGSKNDTDNTEEPSGVGEMSSGSSSGLSHVAPVKLSNSTLVTWKHWLQKLTHWSREKKPRPHCLQHFTISTDDLLPLSDDDDDARDFTEEEHVQSLRSNLKACMSKRSLLVHRDIAASLGAPDVIPVPDPVDTEAWTDQLSHRLTISWQGEEVWREWWEDQLGLNKGGEG